ncbi:MAG: hypothetical protein EZS28_011106 [Streblomastix strix]|uniref:Uncharacterized protein n=1 Tax=Streblomastix strix TaxID=222440 RepID=A0A5J4WFG0_9EUKA|nr:MAG: hypothetical protein EZS28_011106 [Streblomastix strix]
MAIIMMNYFASEDSTVINEVNSALNVKMSQAKVQREMNQFMLIELDLYLMESVNEVDLEYPALYQILDDQIRKLFVVEIDLLVKDYIMVGFIEQLCQDFAVRHFKFVVISLKDLQIVLRFRNFDLKFGRFDVFMEFKILSCQDLFVILMDIVDANLLERS